MTKEISITSILQNLPNKIRKRYHGLPSYIDEVINNNHPKLQTGPHFQNIKNNIKFIIIGNLIIRDFENNTIMIEQSLELFNKMGEKHITVGSTEYTKNNDNTLRGRILSNKLKKIFIEANILFLEFANMSIKNRVNYLLRRD